MPPALNVLLHQSEVLQLNLNLRTKHHPSHPQRAPVVAVLCVVHALVPAVVLPVNIAALLALSATAPQVLVAEVLAIATDPSAPAGNVPSFPPHQQQNVTHSSRRSRSGSRSRSPEINKTLFVKHLSKNLKNEHLEAIFGVFGEIKKAEIVLDRRTGHPHDFGFVEFARRIDADVAIECMHEVRGHVTSIDVLH